MEGHRMHLLS